MIRAVAAWAWRSASSTPASTTTRCSATSSSAISSCPAPDVSLGVGSGSQGRQTAALLVALEDEFLGKCPTRVVVYGDVNSTLAAALVCAKLGIPLAHVEAGLRSFDMTMPEEINRRVTDSLSDLLFVTSPEGSTTSPTRALSAERMHFVGNPMIDTLLAHLDRFDPAAVTGRLGVTGRYAVATLHRPANVDARDAAARLVAALRDLGERLPVILPLHPRGRSVLEAAGLMDVPGVRVIDPLGYLDFLSLVRGAASWSPTRGHPGGDHGPRRAVPDPAAEHGAADHHQPRHQPPGRSRGTGRGR